MVAVLLLLVDLNDPNVETQLVLYNQVVFACLIYCQRVRASPMPKPDKVLRSRPLKEVQAAIEKLKRVVLFHPKPIVEEVPPKYCVCRQGERQKGKKPSRMIQCGDCWEWFHFDCVNIAEDANMENVDWKCEWCNSEIDRVGYQRWKSGRKKPKRRHQKDVPRMNGGTLGGNPPVQYSAPQTWEGKVEDVKELSRRMAVKKRRLKEAVEKLVSEKGHHLVDAEGMAGLELRAVDEGLVDEMVAAGLVEVDDTDDEEGVPSMDA